MATKTTKKQMVESMQNELDTLVTRYCRNKAEMEALKKSVEEDNTRIKELLSLTDKTEHEANGFVVNIVVQHKENFKEDELITFLKETLNTNDKKAVIKTKSYVDDKKLAELVHDGKVCEKELDAYKVCKETTTLRYKQI
jgi:hypothetical protein